MERLPSMLIVHRPVDGTDTRWASFKNPMSPTPLQHVLGVIDFGKFAKSQGTAHAYQKIEDLWQELVQEASEGRAVPTAAPNVDDGTESDTTLKSGNLSPERQSGPETRARKRKRESLRNVTTSTAPTLDAAQFPPPQYGPKDISRDRWGPHKLLMESILASKDKMFFIWYNHPGVAIRSWYLVQARLTREQAKPASWSGEVTCRWFIRHHSDSLKYRLRDCRYWPEIRVVHPNGEFGKIEPIKPAKVEGHLRRRQDRAAYELDIDITAHRMWGPFNFAQPKSTTRNKPNIIGLQAWDKLQTSAKFLNIDADNIDRIVPLRRSK